MHTQNYTHHHTQTFVHKKFSNTRFRADIESITESEMSILIMVKLAQVSLK